MCSAGIVWDLLNHRWHYYDNPRRNITFSDYNFRPSERSEWAAEVKTFLIRDSEGKHLTNEQRSELNKLMSHYEDIFNPGNESTPKVQQYINTGSIPPVAVRLYRMSLLPIEKLKKNLDELLANGTIEKYESLYASPVVLVPKPNGQMRLCIDNLKLKED